MQPTVRATFFQSNLKRLVLGACMMSGYATRLFSHQVALLCSVVTWFKIDECPWPPRPLSLHRPPCTSRSPVILSTALRLESPPWTPTPFSCRTSQLNPLTSSPCLTRFSLNALNLLKRYVESHRVAHEFMMSANMMGHRLALETGAACGYVNQSQ
jgi:hypothetical protein